MIRQSKYLNKSINYVNKKQRIRKYNTGRIVYKVYKKWCSFPGNGAIPSAEQEKRFIITEDIQLAKEVFIFQLFGQRSYELSQKYVKIKKSLMKQFQQKGKIVYRSKFKDYYEKYYDFEDVDDQDFIPQTTYLDVSNNFLLEDNERLLRYKDEDKDQQQKHYFNERKSQKIKPIQQIISINNSIPRKQNTDRIIYQIYRYTYLAPKYESFAAVSQKKWFIETEDIQLAKQVFIFNIFGKRSQELCKKYIKKKKQLMKIFEFNGRVVYKTQVGYSSFNLLENDKIDFVLQTNYLDAKYNFELQEERYLRSQDQDENQKEDIQQQNQ